MSNNMFTFVTMDKHYGTYEAGIAVIMRMTSSEFRLVAQLCWLSNYNSGTVQINPTVRDEICAETHISKSNIGRIFKALQLRKVIAYSRGKVTINPHMFWFGDSANRDRVINSTADLWK